MKMPLLILIFLPLFTSAKPKKTNEQETVLMKVSIPAKAPETIEFSSLKDGKKFVQYYLNGAPIMKKVELSQQSWKKWVEIRNHATKKEGHLIKELPQCQYELWAETRIANSTKDPLKKETWCLPRKNKKLTDSFYNAFREVQRLVKL